MDICAIAKYIVDSLVDDKNEAVVTENGDVIKITVSRADIGKVIGKQGRIAKAVRSVLRAAGQKEGRKITVDISESGAL